MSRTNTPRPISDLGLLSIWRGLVRGLFDSYRPEQHYMRGRGPKWRAKHAPAS